jgi:hypothetical protein
MEKTKWEELSNATIKLRLTELTHEHIVLKEKMLKLSESLEELEKEYYKGNQELDKRYKGK